MRRQLTIVIHVQHILSITEISIDAKIKNQRCQIDKVGEKVNVRLAKLEEYENNIYKVIIPYTEM